MTLTAALAPFTSSSSRSKGERYFHAHAVVHFDPQQSMVYAVVHGTADYVVRVEVVGTSIRCTCTCPFFNDTLQPCKHVWAVALTCDARRVVQVPDGVQSRDLQFVPVPLDEDRGGMVWSGDDPEFASPSHRSAGEGPSEQQRARATMPAWQQALTAIAIDGRTPEVDGPEPLRGRLLYIVDRAGSVQGQGVLVHLLRQELKQNGDWGVPKPARIVVELLPTLPLEDREILEQVAGTRVASPWAWSGSDIPSPFYLKGTLARRLLPAICATGRCSLAITDFPSARPQDGVLVDTAWTDILYRCDLRITRDQDASVYRVEGALVNDSDRVPLKEVNLLVPDGIAFARGLAFRAEPGRLMPWMQQLLARGPLAVPLDQAASLAEALRASGLPDIEELPEELQTRVIDTPPVPQLFLHSDHEPHRFIADLSFSYDNGAAQQMGTSAFAPTGDPRVLARRAADIERAALQRLQDLGVKRQWDYRGRQHVLQTSSAEIPRLVRALLPEGWQITADQTHYHIAAEPPAIEISSGIDWFELRANVNFNGQQVALPQLLEAIHRRDGMIVLDDGSVGVLPEQWLRELAPLALGDAGSDHLRFRRSQVALLDALLASRPSVSWDATATALRTRLDSLAQIPPLDPPPTFAGRLRDYQREALGWLAFLRDFGFGGCLADDMGLGKTVVVLALLDSRRAEREAAGEPTRPSLVVVPRSVLFNWQQEAARFAPRLRVLDLSGADRKSRGHLIAESDIVLTTYGTLRRDAVSLADVSFDYVVLDEAQAIKNAATAGAKAARLLKGEHRLALSGTPVENRLADLWSIFEFLNPGLLAGATAFTRSFTGSSPDDLAMLSRGLRPFILRRTKEQVAVELPPKSEQTIVCELERRQRMLYDELRNHYRQRLLGRNGDSWRRSKIQVLEALLRLRQAACHPALVDPARADDPSAKLDLLVPRLIETIEEGHKALVFSQFTSFLTLLRTELDARKVDYEYLDGATRNREELVDRFQRDPACGLFLISLKAGGVGLNLTAADYVFILDPWWNPAAEAQAVDRTHRIGQQRHVFAYRLIAKDTVEERVLELQQRKRELADAIITADNSIVRTLQREDLEVLLS
jgi:superfamily II DNA or RNA helicase